MKILVTPTSLQPGKESPALRKLEGFSENLVFNSYGRPLTEEELIPLLQDCDGMLAGLDDISGRVIRECPGLKVISRYGVGVERVDLKAASERGVAVTNTPGANSEAVGELAMALVLSLARKITSLDQDTRLGGWSRSEGMELYGKTMGILGMGAIGKVVARCAKGFGMEIIAYDPFVDKVYCEKEDIGVASFEEVMEKSDVISLHLPLTEQTRHIIDRDAIRLMKKGVLLINTSRGGLIDEEAAYEALKAGTLGGLGLDAFEEEPPGRSSLFAFSNVVATPHTGAHTREATSNMASMAVDNLIRVLSGEECPFIVNDK